MPRASKPVVDPSNAEGETNAGNAARHRPATAAGQVRIGPVVAIPDVLRKFGVAPSLPFVRAGVHFDAFKHPENTVPFESLGRLLAESVTLTGCDHFGLLVGECFELGGLGAIGYLMRHSKTVGDALRELLLHLYLHDRGAAPILIDLDASHVLLGYSIYRHGTPGAAQIYDAAIAIGFKALREICGTGWKPVRVQFSYKQPKDTRAYRRLFGSKIEFDSDLSGVVFATSWLDHPIAGADPNLHKLVMEAIRQTRASSALGFSDVLRGALQQMVLSGTSSARNVAFLFGIHERTLRKRLSAEQTSLQELVNQTRFELAKQLLENTQLPLTEIASALRYADAAVFSRAFRGWSHTSPREWRAGMNRGEMSPATSAIVQR